MTILLIAAASAIGAPLRYLSDLWVRRHVDQVFPVGTFGINVLGSFVLGLITGLALRHGLSAGATLALGTGLCGSYTTFSTFTFETAALTDDGSIFVATSNVVLSVAVGLSAGAAGLALGSVV